MTRKDYIVIAEALRIQFLNAKRELEQAEAITLEFYEGRLSGVRSVAVEIADSLQRDNARFNRQHFMQVVYGEKDLLSKPSRKAA